MDRTCFLAESSATTGGLDSMLEPTGTIKVAQEKFARAVGADHVFFVTNGTSTSQDGLPGGYRAGRHRDRRPQLSQITHYGMVLSGRPAAVRRSLPNDRVLDVWRVPLRTIKQALLNLKAEGRLDA